MNFDAVTIERMVREVLDQVQRPASVRTNAVPTNNTLLKVPVAAPVVTPSVPAVVTVPTVVIRERIVTADVLKDQTKPGSKVVIAKKAILTPAAQDYLRNFRIAIERSDTSPVGNSVAAVRWKILLSSVAEHTARAIDAVCQQQSTVQHELSGTAIEAVSTAVSAISRAEVAGVIVVSAAPQVVACRANRNHLIRAAVVSDLASWQQVQPQLRPNVVCINPRDRGFMELQNVINKVLTSPAPEVPAGWL
jgi:ribose 5-phosphate isomerase RpiB